MQNYPETKADSYLIYFPNSDYFYRLAFPKKVLSKKSLFLDYRK